MAGLIRKVIWIWPKWTDHLHSSPDLLMQMEVGWAQVEGFNRNKYKVFCMCFHNETIKARECIYVPLHLTERTEISIKAQLCHIKKSFVYKEIREDLAYQKLYKGKLISSSDSILLDIDEDFYGCAFASKPLLDANISMDHIHKLDSMLLRLFCPQDATQEQEADKMLVTVLGIFRKASTCLESNNIVNNRTNMQTKAGGKISDGHVRGNKVTFSPYHGQSKPKLTGYPHTSLNKVDMGTANRSSVKKIPTGVKCKDNSQAVMKEVEFILKKYLWQSKNSVACGKRTQQSERLLKELLNNFKQHSQRQLRSLQYVGFCLASSYTPVKQSRAHFHICHGLNYPDNSAVDVYIPPLSEIHQRTKLLQDILSPLRGRKTCMATVCRSVRDGYTPRRYFNKIESDVLKTLNTTFKNLQLRYATNLLGGKRGWPSRHKVSPK